MIERRQNAPVKQMLPTIDDVNVRVTVDPTWGTVQPQHLHPEIETIGELELIASIERGCRLIDTRRPEYVAQLGTIPGSIAIDWEHIDQHIDQLDANGTNILYCNGPQCAATPRAVERLLAAGFNPGHLTYYRGGIHDWVTLGYPLEPLA